MRYLAKENCPRQTSWVTSQPGMSLTAVATARQMVATSRPESSRGSSPSTAGRCNWKSWRSISSKVRLKRGSSSCRDREKPERTAFRARLTGMRINGAL